MSTEPEWPAHTSEERAWSGSRSGPREDRMFDRVVVSLPPFISELQYSPSAATVRELEAATRDILELDVTAGARLHSLGQFLMRTDSVSSSKIEYIDAGADDYARALAGMKSNSSATSMVAATAALQDLIEKSGSAGQITLSAIVEAHRILMADDPFDGANAGKLRTVQNWIGGSDHSPRGAIHVPPPPEVVGEYMDDLLRFANRNDMSAVAQAAIVHAQFESIHTFTDGNGRIGRALINAVLRRRGLTTVTVTPLATAMVADRDGYFTLVNDYRAGSLTPFVESVAVSAQIACRAALVSAQELQALPALWASKTAARAGSGAAQILAVLLEQPVLSADDAIRLTGGSETSIYAGLNRLVQDEVLHEVTARKRNQVWAATEVLDEMTRLAERIAAAVVARGHSAG
jgi:Fic family protein